MSTLRQKIRRVVPPILRPYLGALRRSAVANPARVRLQKRRLMKSAALSAGQLELLRRVSARIHPRDGMYAGNGEQYFLAGLSALACVDEVLRAAPRTETVTEVLDMPSGYGRELRFLLLRFPGATFTACDIQPGAADFCAREFGALPVISRPHLDDVSFERKFDLVWCGSLVTHLDAASTRDLLRLFARHLKEGGVAIFTSHGDHVLRRMRDEGETYELDPESIPPLVADYEASGHAYRDYPRGLGYFTFHPEGRGYGISLTSPGWLRRQIAEVGGLEEVYFEERGWAGHQDVFAFARRG